MKKENQQPNLLKTNIGSAKNLGTDIIKTTNINILLNRVKLDRKKEFKKRIIFLLILTTVISLTAVSLII